MSGLSTKDEVLQISSLVYCMGDQAEDILSSFKLTNEETKKYSKVLEKFKEHFGVRKNVIYERAKFNKRKQFEDESVNNFITALYVLVENCDYGSLKEEMIRDRIVVGIKDENLSEELQLTPDLTLKTATDKVKERELVTKQQVDLRGETSESNIDTVKSRKYVKRRYKQVNCYRCGKPHNPNTCFAKSLKCRKCSKMGHIQVVCRSKAAQASTRAKTS